MIPHGMAEVVVEGNELVVRLGRWEQLAALRRDIRVPLAAARAAVIEREPFRALRGIRAPGTAWPGRIAYGVWRTVRGRPDFAAIRRGVPVIRVELDPPAQFGRLLVSMDDAEAALSRLDAAR
jgi:pilus assembly protein TadC